MMKCKKFINTEKDFIIPYFIYNNGNLENYV